MTHPIGGGFLYTIGMPIKWLAAAFLLFSVVSARAQTAPPEKPKLEEFCALLRQLSPLSLGAARAELSAHGSESPAGRYLLDALAHFKDDQASVETFLAPADTDGGLRGTFIRLAPIGLQDAAKKIGDVTAQDFGGGEVPDKDGFEHHTEVNGGAARYGLVFAPAAGLAHDTEFKSGAWGAEAELEGTFSPGVNAVPGIYSLGVSGTRDIGKSRFFGLVDFDFDHDSYLGAQGTALRAGAGVHALDNKKQELNVSLGLGPNVESAFNGVTERFLSPAASVEYVYKAAGKFRFGESLEGEFNAVHTSDIEFKAVTSAVWDMSEKFALKAANTFKLRTEQVQGYAAQRTFGTLGVIWNY